MGAHVSIQVFSRDGQFCSPALERTHVYKNHTVACVTPWYCALSLTYLWPACLGENISCSPQ